MNDFDGSMVCVHTHLCFGYGMITLSSNIQTDDTMMIHHYYY